jgi:hypothetical protein
MSYELWAIIVLCFISNLAMVVALVFMSRTTRETHSKTVNMWLEASRQALAISSHELDRRKIEIESATRIDRARESVPDKLPGYPSPNRFAPTVESPSAYNDGDVEITGKF